MLHGEYGGIFHFKVYLLKRLPNTIELSHDLDLNIFKNPELSFYAILFDDSEESIFDIATGHINVGVIIKPVPDAPSLYVFSISVFIVSFLHCHLLFLGWCQSCSISF